MQMVKGETMQRYIDAEQAKTELKHWCMETAINNVGSVIGYPEDIYADVAQNRIDIWIDNVPTADVQEVRHGEWYRPREWPGKTYRRLCTNCQDVAYYCGNGNYKYCPNCGARMDAETQKGENK